MSEAKRKITSCTLSTYGPNSLTSSKSLCGIISVLHMKNLRLPNLKPGVYPSRSNKNKILNSVLRMRMFRN
jgi:hypothetical protein